MMLLKRTGVIEWLTTEIRIRILEKGRAITYK